MQTHKTLVARRNDNGSRPRRSLAVTSYSLTRIAVVILLLFGPTPFLSAHATQAQPGSSLYPSAQVSVDASALLGSYAPRGEQFVAAIHVTKGPKDQQLLRDLKLKYVRGFLRLQQISIAEGEYNFSEDQAFSLHHSMFRDIRALGAKPITTIAGLPDWLKGANNSPSDYDKYEKVIYDILSHYKARYPEIEYVEFENEPDCCASEQIIPAANYNRMYAAAAAAIQQINAGLPTDATPLKIGGPTTANFDVERIGSLIDYSKAHNLPLDFVSWHSYEHANDPAALKTDVEMARTWLQQGGFASAQTFVTEWQRNATSGEMVTPERAAQSATFAAVGNYYWLLGGLDVGTIFALSDYANPNRTLLAPAGSWTQQNGPGRSEEDGFVMPVYNVYKMFSMLKSDRIQAISSAQEPSGQGVGSLATTDRSGVVAILLWNYQRSGAAGYTASLRVDHLPPSFGHGFTVDTYLVDSTHSNSLYNPANPGVLVNTGLEKITSFQQAGSGSYAGQVELAANSVALVYMAANSTGAPSPTVSSPSPTPTASSPAPPSTRPAPNEPPDPLTCQGYLEPHIFLESQAWWIPMPGKSGNNFGHVHIGTCFPYRQIVRGQVQFDIRLILHNNPGVLNRVQVQVNNPEDGAKDFVLYQDRNVGFTCSETTCTRIVTVLVDTRGLPDGVRQFAFKAYVTEPDGSLMIATNNWRAFVANLDPNPADTSGYYAIASRAWYSEVGYANSKISSEFPIAPLSDFFVLRAQLTEKGSLTPVLRSAVVLDADFHADVPGTVVKEVAGPMAEWVRVDVRALASGGHRLSLIQDRQFGNQILRSILVVPFTVSDTAPAPTPTPTKTGVLPTPTRTAVPHPTQTPIPSSTAVAPSTPEAEIEVVGMLTATNGNVWTVNGIVVIVSGETRIEDELYIGDTVKVEGTLQANGTVLAREIELLDDD